MSRSRLSQIGRQLTSSLRPEHSAVAGPSIPRRFLQFSAAGTSVEHPNPPPPNAPPHKGYKFSKNVHFPPSVTPSPIPKHLLKPKKGWAVIEHLNSEFRQQLDPPGLIKVLFGRRTSDRLRSGSIITVHSWTDASKTAVSSFSGVLIGTRHRGVDTSIRLRNIVNKLGVEMSYKLYSPLLKEIKVVKRAERGKAAVKDLRHNKPYFLRDRPELLKGIAGAVKVGKKLDTDAAQYRATKM